MTVQELYERFEALIALGHGELRVDLTQVDEPEPVAWIELVLEGRVIGTRNSVWPPDSYVALSAYRPTHGEG